MAARVRGSCNKEHQIRTRLEEALKQAKSCLQKELEAARGVVLKVARQGANFIVEFRNEHENLPIPTMLVHLISEAIADVVKRLKLSLKRHSSDGFHVTYKLASG